VEPIGEGYGSKAALEYISVGLKAYAKVADHVL